MSNKLNLTLKVWRQESSDSHGDFVDYSMEGVNPHMSFLELLDVLNERLSDICNISCVGLNSFRMDFYDTNFEFEDKKTKCDFDVDDYNLPIMIDGGQSFILPYLNQLTEFYDDLIICYLYDCHVGQVEISQLI